MCGVKELWKDIKRGKQRTVGHMRRQQTEGNQGQQEEGAVYTHINLLTKVMICYWLYTKISVKILN